MKHAPLLKADVDSDNPPVFTIVRESSMQAIQAQEVVEPAERVSP